MMATVVGVFLIILICIGVPLEHLATEGSDPQRVGAWIATVLGTAHGFLYMIFIVTAVVLSRTCRWSIGFTLLIIIAGTIPFVSFFGERKATRAARSDLARRAAEDSRV